MEEIQPNEKLLRRVREHLAEVSEKPQTPLDADLLRIAAYDLPGPAKDSFSLQSRQLLIIQLYQLLPTLQQSPEPLVHLLSRLLQDIRLSAILDLDPPVDFVAGLDLDSKAYHSLTLSLLEKVDKESAERLATNHRPVFDSLVKLWLCVEDAGIASRAHSVLLHLLKQGGDLVFKRMFRDKDVYELLYALCSAQSPQEPIRLSKTRKTIAQARLLDWLPEVASLNWDVVVHNHHPEVEALYGLKSGEGLLDFAALRMVDYEEDVLMGRTLINFFTSLLPGAKHMDDFFESRTRKSSLPLDFLVSRGLHARTLNTYAHPEIEDPILISFLYPEAAKYVARFALTHPIAFQSDELSKTSVLSRLKTAFSIPASHWTVPSSSPSADLHVLVSLPRASLLGESSPVSLLPSRSPSVDVLHTLATLFHGPLEGDSTVFPPRTAESNDALQDEVRCANLLYNNYLTAGLYPDIIGHANRLAVPDVSIAALTLLRAIITAQWDGAAAVMGAHARPIVIPYLLGKPNVSISVTSEAAKFVRRIAEARYGLAKDLADRLDDNNEWWEVQAALRQRVEDGVWGVRSGHGSGVPTIATMGSE